jgi:hypothetical protein
MRLTTRTGAGVKLALASIAVSCMALLLPGGAATAATVTKTQPSSASASAALLQQTGLRDATATATAKPTIIVTRSTTAAPHHGSANIAANPLTVFVVNFTTTTFNAVNIAVIRNGDPQPLPEFATQGPLRPNSLVAFSIDNCTDVKQYAFNVVLNGAIVAASGNVTPDATDGNLCSDIWDIG